METEEAGLGISSQQHHWRNVYFLGVILLFVLILIPLSVVYAQGNKNYTHDLGKTGGVSIILQATSTPTDTPTATSTYTAVPTEINPGTTTATATLTETPPTITATSTATATSTGVQPTNTSTSTPTITGTQRTSTITPTATKTPTPTVTGTLTGVAKLTVIVTPASAKVNESFTFTITAGNIGTISTHDNIVFDSFPGTIDVNTVTTSRGTITKGTHFLQVNLGDIAPAETVTIVASVKVNSTLARTESYANIVTITYDGSKSLTASVNYTAQFQALPPTGELPLNWRESRLFPSGLIPGMLLMVMGMVLLLIGIWSRVNERKNTLWMIAGGAWLVIVGFAIGVNAMGIESPTQQAIISQNPESAEVVIGQHVEQTGSSIQHLPAASFSTPDALVPVGTLPDYPIPTPVITVTPKPGEAGPDLSAVERIAIPSLFLDTIVKYVPYDGFSWMISGLRQEVAWMGNTSWPGLGSNTALAGHVTVAGMGDGPFRHLDELPVGEVVILYTEKNIYTYQVRETKVTDDSDMSVTLGTDNPQITLITCTNWNQDARTYLNRLIVVADLVRTEPITSGYVP